MCMYVLSCHSWIGSDKTNSPCVTEHEQTTVENRRFLQSDIINTRSKLITQNKSHFSCKNSPPTVMISLSPAEND